MTAVPGDPSRSMSPALATFLLLMGVYLASASFRVDTLDTGIRLAVARNLATAAGPAVAPLQFPTPFGLVGSFPGADGQHYSVYGLGQSLLFMPVAWLPAPFDAALASLTNPVITAVTCALLIPLASALGFSTAAGTSVALLVGLATLAWPQAKLTFEAPIEMLCLVVAWLGVARRSTRGAALAGLALGFALVTRPSATLFAPGLAIWLGLPHDREARARWIAFVLATLPGIATFLGYNALRWGSPFGSGYALTEFQYFDLSWKGFVGLLVSPGRGFFWYSPVLLLGLFGFGALARRHRTAALAAAITAATYFLFLGFTRVWNGDWTYGPRHLTPLVPLLALPLLPLLEERRFPQAVWIVVVSLSVIVQIPGIAVNYEAYYLLQNQRARETGLVRYPGDDHFDFGSPQYYVQARQTALFFSELGPRVTQFVPERDVSPFAPILEKRSAITLRVPDFWWIYFPMVGISPVFSSLLGLASVGLVATGLRTLLRLRDTRRAR